MEHRMQLQRGPFEQIASGTKTIEVRLNDEKRQKVAVGDTIVFSDAAGASRTLRVRVTDLYRYPTFKELFAAHPARAFGGTNAEELLTTVRTYYSEEDEKAYGVVGIGVEVA